MPNVWNNPKELIEGDLKTRKKQEFELALPKVFA
jgi:hypothetical protein